MAAIEASTNAGGRVVLDESAVGEFRANLRGDVLDPNHPEYEVARRTWNRHWDKRPALVARCAGTADVMTAVRFARAHELLVAVRGGGHNVAGRSSCDGGLMIDLTPMKGIRVVARQRTARAQGGALLGDLDIETQAFGLATTLGVLPDTGIAGLTLGGGYGWLEGKYGLTCDNLLSVDVVTADGQMVTASEEENADLFWGIRGAGANFGIVTSFEYQLHELSTVLGGMVIYSLSQGREVLRAYNEFASTAPDEVSGIAAVVTAPDGAPCVAIVLCYSGDLSNGERILKPLRNAATPVADLIQPIPYLAMQRLLVDAFPVGHSYYWRGNLIRELSEGTIDTVVDFGARMPTPLTSIGFQQIHGAASRVDASATAFPHRYSHHDFFPTAIWADPTDADRCIRWARECSDAMQQFVERAAYVNDLGDEGEDLVRAAYGENYERLVELKRKYDPTNLFQLNQNVKPSL